jgi:hypothetical protein
MPAVTAGSLTPFVPVGVAPSIVPFSRPIRNSGCRAENRRESHNEDLEKNHGERRAMTPSWQRSGSCPPKKSWLEK